MTPPAARRSRLSPSVTGPAGSVAAVARFKGLPGGDGWRRAMTAAAVVLLIAVVLSIAAIAILLQTAGLD